MDAGRRPGRGNHDVGRENALAAVRQYDKLSQHVGLRALAGAVPLWRDAADAVAPDASAEHPRYGTLTAADVIRRNAHEVHHHAWDIARSPIAPR